MCASSEIVSSQPCAMLVHGLNNRASSMSFLEQLLADAGIHTRLVVLAGHEIGRSEHSDYRMDHGQWLQQLVDADQAMRAESVCGRRIFVGYSLGGALGIELMLAERLRFDAMILLAPALVVHWWLHGLKLLHPFGRLRLPSLVPEKYRVHPGTSIRAYMAAFDSIHAIKTSNNTPVLNIPALLFIDPADELVSCKGIEAYRRRHDLQHWRIERLSKARAWRSRAYYHHLIFNPEELGESAWRMLQENISAFLASLTA